MRKHRIIIVVLSIVFIVVLYFLPRIVVNNEKDQEMGMAIGERASESEAGEPGHENKDVHAMEISQPDLERINSYRQSLQEERSDKLVMADSLANIFMAYNKYDSAAKYFEIIARENPGLEEYERAGNAYYDALGFALDKTRAESYGEKVRYYFDIILREDPARLDIKNKLAMSYISSENPMRGIALLREILEENPEDETALFNMGILAVQSGQYERASERFKNLVSLYPQNLKGQFYLGLCFFEMGQNDKARKQFELVKSMEDDPAVLATVEGYLKELN